MDADKEAREIIARYFIGPLTVHQLKDEFAAALRRVEADARAAALEEAAQRIDRVGECDCMRCADRTWLADAIRALSQPRATERSGT